MKLELSYKKTFSTYAYPMMLRSVINSLMHTADRLVAALFIGAQALVATTITSPLMYLSYGIAALFIGGMGAYVGLLIGKENVKKASEVSSSILIILVMVGVLITIPTFLYHDKIVSFLGARGEITAMASSYLKIFSLSFPFMLLGRGMDVLICNDGSPKYSFVLNIITTTLNLALNIVAVAIFKWGIIGLAIATVISEAVQFLGGCVYFLFKSKIIKLSHPKINFNTVLRISYNGLSDFAMLIVDAVMVYVVNQAFVRYLSPSHFEAYAAANILMIIFYGIFMGATGGLQPILSQMMGRGNFNELKGLLKYSVNKTMKIGIVVYITFIPVANLILSFFVESDETLRIAKFFYLTMGFAILFSNMPLQASIFFTAINRPLESAAISVVRTLVLIPPIAYIGIMTIGPLGVALGFFLTDIILIGILTVYMKKLDISKLTIYE